MAPPEVALHLLEITLISAQDLKSPSSSSSASFAADVGERRRMKTYAVVWVDPSAKLRTLVDPAGGANPTWNEKFLFRVPSGFLAADSPSAVHVEIRVLGRLADPLVGAVHFLVGNEKLLSRPAGEPSFAALGIRRPSGRFHGVLNVGSAILPVRHVSAVAAAALAGGGREAVGYRCLMGEATKIRPSGQDWRRAFKERNEERRGGSDGAGGLCGLGFQRRNLLEPLDENCPPRRTSK